MTGTCENLVSPIPNRLALRTLDQPERREITALPSKPIGWREESRMDGTTRLTLFEETILPHLKSAHNLARWLTRNEDDAQDVVQEAYLRAFRFFDGFKGGDGKAWLLAVVRNTCLTWRRRQKNTLADVAFDEATHGSDRGVTVEAGLVEEASMAPLRKCIESLPVEYREIIIMRELEELSYREIADIAAIPIGTVMSRLARARKRLEECVRSTKGNQR